MAIKKSELYSSLWEGCDQLRGGMDASQYKDYVLFMLFIKYVSDKYADYDGFEPPVTIPAGSSFKDMIKLKGKSDIGEKINTQIITPLINSNSRLARSDFPDFNDPNKLGEGKAMVDRLTNLISIFQKPALDFSKNRADHDDILGDAYEYLMRHFAQESGKSKGQFYTPSEVSRVIAKVVGISPQNAVASTTAYDPTCGSGSLLLKVAAEARKPITLEGQEKDVTTAGLARMNMILHDFPTANILNGNTLSNPKFKDGERLRTYDYVVANPPFSDKSWSTGLTPAIDPYQRFAWGEPPAKQGDYAYLLHIIRSMKSTGKGACILPHGVLFRGNAEAAIRKNLITSGFLKGIIGLPANLFYGTGIPACILVLDKENTRNRTGIFMIDASKGFIKDGNKNRLREQDIHKIVDTFIKQTETPGFSRLVPFEEISDARNDYNLNIPRYIDSTEAEDIQDIDGHLRGGIPENDLETMHEYWKVMPSLRAALFKSAGRPNYSSLKLEISEVKKAILEHSEFKGFKDSIIAVFEKWQKEVRPVMNGFDKDGQPKEFIENISEKILGDFKPVPLVDAYDVYQHLMDYWVETMQDDAYLIAADGWVAKTYRITETDKQGNEKDKGWTCDLIPKQYIVNRYFQAEQSAIDDLQAELDSVTTELTELAEENGGEEGPLKDVFNKSDAQQAYTDAILALWAEDNKADYDKYNCLNSEADEAGAQLKTLTDHHYISVLKNAKGKLALKSVKDQLNKASVPAETEVLNNYIAADATQKEKAKEAKSLFEKIEKKFLEQLKKKPVAESLTDLAVTIKYLGLLEKQGGIKSSLKDAEKELDQKAHDKYPELSVDEIKSIVIDDKWLTKVESDVKAELERVSQTITSRIRLLAERYATPLPELENEVGLLSAKVKEHLCKMGAVWN
ncbi:MAG: type I restriction-modification system subunit M [Candidatus Rifleibacteriota bacterium]